GRRVDTPQVDVGTLRIGDGSIHVGVVRTERSAKVVDTRRDQKHRAAPAGFRPTLDQVDHGEIRTGRGGNSARQTQRFGRKRVVAGKILRDHGGVVGGVKDRDRRAGRLRHDERLEIVHLDGHAGIERVIDQNRQRKRVRFGPFRYLLSFFSSRQLYIVFVDRRRRGFLLADGGHCDGRFASGGRRLCCTHSGYAEKSKTQKQHGP